MQEGCKRGARGVQKGCNPKSHKKNMQNRAKWKGVVDNREQAIQNKTNKNIHYRAKGRGCKRGARVVQKGCKRGARGVQSHEARFECRESGQGSFFLKYWSANPLGGLILVRPTRWGV